MVPYLPKQIAVRAILVYLIALTVISLVFSDYSMKIGYMVLGLTFVLGYFSITNYWSKGKQAQRTKEFLNTLFIVALLIRLIWVVVSYLLYIKLTGIPFEFDTADALGYHEEAKWLVEEGWLEVMLEKEDNP